MSDPTLRTRRGFLKTVSAIVGSAVGVALALPFLDAVVAPSLRVKKGHFARLVRLSDLPTGTPVDRKFADQASDAFIRETLLRDVWVVKHGPDKVDVFSPICPHLGCRYEWHQARKEFVCPCHGSVFAVNGKVVGGPAPRPLDTLPIRIERGAIYVEWERFKVGVPRKIVV